MTEAPPRPEHLREHAAQIRQRLVLRIGLGMALLAALIVASWSAVTQLVTTQQTDAPTLNTSGRQRMLTQRVSRLAIQYASAQTAAGRERIGAELDAAIARMADAHDALQHGRPGSGIAAPGSAAIQELFGGAPGLAQRIDDYLVTAEALRRLPEREIDPAHPLVVRLLAEADPLLADLEQLVGHHEAESSARVEGLRRLALGLLVAILLVMVAEGFLIFLPLVQHIVDQIRQIGDREAALRLVLDNTGDGLVVVDCQGRVLPGWSTQLEAWFGPISAGQSLGSALFQSRSEQQFAELAFAQLADGTMPEQVALEQLPSSIRRGRRRYRVGYRRIEDADTAGAWLVSVNDVTEELAAVEAERESRELHEVLDRVLAGRGTFRSFRDEVVRLFDTALDAMASGDDPAARKTLIRALHTIRADTAVFGFRTVSELVEQLETALAQGAVDDGRAELQRIRERWASDVATTTPFVERATEEVSLPVEALAEHVERLQRAAPHAELLADVQGWLLDPVRVHLEHLGANARRIAERLDKFVEVVVVDEGRARLPVESLAPLWGALVHVVRNAIDHGVERAAERTAAGKPARATLELACAVLDDALHVTILDDGAGIDWSTLTARARQLGHAVDPDDPTELLYIPGLSRLPAQGELSGRGEGMPTVRDVVRQLGGRIEVHTARGRGTCFHVTIPLSRTPTAGPLGAQIVEETGSTS